MDKSVATLCTRYYISAFLKYLIHVCISQTHKLTTNGDVTAICERVELALHNTYAELINLSGDLAHTIILTASENERRPDQYTYLVP